MVDHDPLIQAAAEYLTSVDHIDGTDLYAAPWGLWEDSTMYKVDGEVNLAGLIKAIMDVRQSFIWEGFRQSEEIIAKARTWEAWVRAGLEDHEQTIDAAWAREHLDTLRQIVADPISQTRGDHEG